MATGRSWRLGYWARHPAGITSLAVPDTAERLLKRQRATLDVLVEALETDEQLNGPKLAAPLAGPA